MKKVITILLAISMLASMTTLFVGCDEDHVHTFASEWSGDATHHWHAANCEHITEVSDKAEHNFGADNKCTVCQRAYESKATTNTDAWKNAIQNIQNSKNIKMDFRFSLDNERGYTILEIDGDKQCATHYEISEPFTPEDAFFEKEILIKNADNTYDYYTQTEENGVWAISAFDENDISRWTQLKTEIATFAQIATDEFANAVFDKATETYTLTKESATVSQMNLTNLVYKFMFENNELKKVELTFKMGELVYEGVFTFGSVSVNAPAEAHTFATEWSTDETYHWHAATCEHTTLVFDKGKHSYLTSSSSSCYYCEKQKPAA